MCEARYTVPKDAEGIMTPLGELNKLRADNLQLIVATSNYQVPYIDQLQTHSLHKSFLTKARPSQYESNSVIPAYFLSGSEAQEMEPDLSDNVVAALLVTETGIVDSQTLVDSLAREIEEPEYLFTSNNEEVAVGVSMGRREESGEGVLVRGTRVVRIDREKKGKGWVVQLETGWEGKEEGEQGEVESVLAEVVVNAAGLAETSLLENVVPERERVQTWPTKGGCCDTPLQRNIPCEYGKR